MTTFEIRPRRRARRCCACALWRHCCRLRRSRAAGRPEQMVAGIRALHRGHRGIRHGGGLRQGHAARLQGAPDVLVSGRVRGRPRPAAPVLQGFLRGLPQDLSEHRARGTGLTYNDLLDKFRTALLGNAAPMAVRLQILGGTEFAAKGYLRAAQARGRRLVDRGLLARRHEGGDLGRRDLRHPDQQRDDGAHLERRHLQACRSRSGQAAGNLGRRRRLLQADPRQARHRRLRPRGPQERRQHAVPLHAPALGLRRRRVRRSRSEPDLWRDPAEQRSQQARPAGVLRHVCPRQVGAGLGADQPAGRQPGACSSPASWA